MQVAVTCCDILRPHGLDEGKVHMHRQSRKHIASVGIGCNKNVAVRKALKRQKLCNVDTAPHKLSKGLTEQCQTPLQHIFNMCCKQLETAEVQPTQSYW